MKRKCETCIKRKTPYCPTSIECMATDDMPYYQNKIMLLEENKHLKDNWNKLKRWLYEDHCLYVREVARNSTYQKVLEKMEEIEKGEKQWVIKNLKST